VLDHLALTGRLLDAVYIPPPAAEVVQLLDDLVAFLNREDMPAIAQAAIAHAQFETIHPLRTSTDEQVAVSSI
jgi:Fic family protein